MKLIITFPRDIAAFVIQVVDARGEQLSALETTDMFILMREVQMQLLRMRHLARGKVFETKQPRSGA